MAELLWEGFIRIVARNSEEGIAISVDDTIDVWKLKSVIDNLDERWRDTVINAFTARLEYIKYLFLFITLMDLKNNKL